MILTLMVLGLILDGIELVKSRLIDLLLRERVDDLWVEYTLGIHLLLLLLLLHHLLVHHVNL